jgi:phage shock protein PspC (stress-responsive transcriptional regulator)
MDETRTCPHCGETIRAEAVRCRYCRARLTVLDPERWHRNHPERRLAGVAAAVARAFTLPVGVVRTGFVVLSFFHLFGPVLYGALWLIVPFDPGGDAPLTRAVAWARGVLASLRAREVPRPDATRTDAPPAPPRAARAVGLPARPLP